MNNQTKFEKIQKKFDDSIIFCIFAVEGSDAKLLTNNYSDASIDKHRKNIVDAMVSLEKV